MSAVITGAATVAAALITVRAGRTPPAGTAAPGRQADARVGLVARGRGLLDRLPALERRRRLWVAALAGFFLSGFGVALVFRTLPDSLVGAVLAIPFAVMVALQPDGQEAASTPWWYWPFAAVAALYAVLRAESANRRLERKA